MRQFQAIVTELSVIILAIGPDDFHSGGPSMEGNGIIAIYKKVSPEQLTEKLLSIIGKGKVEKFYSGYEPVRAGATFHFLRSVMAGVLSCCRITPEGRISFQSEEAEANFEHLTNCINLGKFPYTFSLRILNIDIETDFKLADGIRFQKLLPTVVEKKYRIERFFTSIVAFDEQYWLKHCVEVVLDRVGSPVELQKSTKIEETESITNSILDTFHLAEVTNFQPSVSHFVVDSPIESSCHIRDFGRISSSPTLITQDKVTAIQNTYAFLMRLKTDRILETAVDRFLIGKKQGTQHVNRINEPNWDKIVDYVIAMETLFLTVEGNSAGLELAYRFRLNGSSLIRMVAKSDRRKVFHALNSLYTLRSKVVHGSDDREMLKAAERFLACLDVDCPEHRHPIGRLMLVAKQLESWMKMLFIFIDKMPLEMRPYRKKDGWEDMIWSI